MTPTQKIKLEILKRGVKDTSFVLEEIDENNIDEIYEEMKNDYNCPFYVQDEESEFRYGQYETNIPCEYNRHYETKSVAAQLEDGSIVGWTHYYGGGKHGYPEEIEWMKYAYELEMTEEEKLVIVRTFKKKES